MSAVDRLEPKADRIDYLISAGPYALISARSQTVVWPFALEGFEGRLSLGFTLEAHRDEQKNLRITPQGDLTSFGPIFLSLFVRACIRRATVPECQLIWSLPFNLVADDPLRRRTSMRDGKLHLRASYTDLRPDRQSEIAEVYRHPLDIPWLYDPLDYDAMLPILGRSISVI